MRLFLLPISTRKTLIYCQRLNVAISEKQTLLDKGTTRAANLWASWEKKESGWQKWIVEVGNKALKRISFEEWGLKSIPPLSARRKEEELSEKEAKVEVSFPPALIPVKTVPEVLKVLATARQGFHKSRMMYCFIGMPITAPIALIPVVPNLPFFYLVYRAWSHWRALSGSKHIQFLLENNLVVPKASPILDVLYSAGIMRAVRDGTVIATKPIPISQSTTEAGPKASESKETLVLDRWNATLIARALELPELEAELDRAIWQVENSIRSKAELREEKEGLEKATAANDPQAKGQEKR